MFKVRQAYTPSVGLATRRMSRPTETCPKCGGQARAASYRGEKPPGAKSGQQISIGRSYCPKCDYLLPRGK